MPATLSRSLLLGALLGATACTSTTLNPTIKTNPPDAQLFINGEAVGDGMERTHSIDFANTTRCWIQGTQINGTPTTLKPITKQELEQMMRKGTIIVNCGN